MRLRDLCDTWRREKLGLTMIVATLGVIGVTVWVFLAHEQQTQRDNLDEQGLNLARILSQMPFESFSADARLLSVLHQGQDRRTFAYVAVVNEIGETIQQVTAPGVSIPMVAPTSSPTGWVGARSLVPPDQGRQIQEFHAPLFDSDGDAVGHVRLGYFAPTFGFSDVPVFATPALLIFLLVPLFYFLIRKETRPLAGIATQLESLAARVAIPTVEVAATGELGTFMAKFGQFIDRAQHRLDELETEREGLEVSTKLLAYQRSRVESVLECFPDGVMVLDESGAVRVANQRFCRVLGVAVNDIIGLRPAEWCTNEDLVAFLASHEGKTARGYHTEALEFSPKGAGDAVLAVSPYPLFSPQDGSKILGTLVVLRDITTENLARRAGSEFIAHMAHELKTPLTTLSLYSESLLTEDGQDEVLRVEAANIIFDEVGRMGMLIQNILNITKIESGTITVERRHAKLRDLLEDAFAACQRGAGDKGLSFQLDLPHDLAPVALDKELLRIAINNLLTNAVKYTDPGGTVTLTAEETDRVVRIVVSDDGVGIDPAENDAIFQKFYRSENEDVRKRTGHGLGLSLARQIVHLHHGTLSVESQVGQGSAFTIELNRDVGLLKEAV